MARVTVKILEAGDTHERDFHLDETKAEAFAAKVRSAGGTARVVPFQMSPALLAMLAKAGVDSTTIK